MPNQDERYSSRIERCILSKAAYKSMKKFVEICQSSRGLIELHEMREQLMVRLAFLTAAW